VPFYAAHRVSFNIQYAKNRTHSLLRYPVVFDVVQTSSYREASVHALENAAKERRAQGIYGSKRKNAIVIVE
jgi:hypothetical protein